MNREQRIELANTIIQQLGGSRFKMMTGAKDFMALDSGVVFRLPYPKTNKVEIALTPADLYKMVVYRVRKTQGIPTSTVVAEVNDLYCEDLQDAFSNATGLATRF